MEVKGLLVVVVEDLGEDLVVLAVAPGVVHALQVGVVDIFPAGTEELGLAAAALGVAGVAELALIAQHLAPGLVDDRADVVAHGHRKSLISLTMIIRAHVEVVVRGVVFHSRHQPASGDDGVGLEQVHGGAGLHLGGDDAQQVVLHAHEVHRADLVPLDDEFQAAGVLQRAFLLPVEVDADHDVVQDEGGLGEARGARDGVEVELVVERAVVGDAALAVAHALRAGAVRDDLEADLVGGQDAHGHGRLLAREVPFDHLLLVLGDGDLVQDGLQQRGRGFFVVLAEGGHEHARHIGGAGVRWSGPSASKWWERLALRSTTKQRHSSSLT